MREKNIIVEAPPVRTRGRRKIEGRIMDLAIPAYERHGARTHHGSTAAKSAAPSGAGNARVVAQHIIRPTMSP